MGELSRRKYIFATSVAVFCAYCGVSQSAVMSKYGEIQPVNKYSSNPFWTPDSPYNLRFPSPIYATGPDLNTETCNNTVAALVNSYCSANNNCSKLQVSDVRPKIMVQLSQLPGHNYATSCGGYIDNAVKEYKKNHGNSFSGINVVQQPKTTKPLSLTDVVTSQPKTKSDGVAERTAELEQVQSMTTQTIDVAETDFPKTIADLSFVDRVANATAGYEPYKDLKSYHIPKFETEQEYYSRMESVLKHNINYETYNGKPKSKSPTSYLTGRGAKITWHPTREYSTFKGWCENEDLTLNPDDCPANCPMEPTIDPMSKSDKSFYACWECDAGIDLIKHNCGCPDTHMDVKNNCECKLKKLSHRDGDKCVCNDPRLDIDSDCKCPVGSHMTQDPSTGICACRDPYKPDPTNPGICKCKDPNGDANNNCSITCPDGNALMDPTNGCKCPSRTNNTADPNKCECDNGAGNPPDCTCEHEHTDPSTCKCIDPNAQQMDGSCKCPAGQDFNASHMCEALPPCPDSHMTRNGAGTCECQAPYKNDPGDPNKCICQDEYGDPSNNCNALYVFYMCPQVGGFDDKPGVEYITSFSGAPATFGCHWFTTSTGDYYNCITACKGPESSDHAPTTEGALNKIATSVIGIGVKNFCAGFETEGRRGYSTEYYDRLMMTDSDGKATTTMWATGESTTLSLMGAWKGACNLSNSTIHLGMFVFKTSFKTGSKRYRKIGLIHITDN